MDFRLHWRNLTIYCGLTWSRTQYGVHSTLSDGQHLLLWDFDGVPFGHVVAALRGQQRTYNLPQITILQSSAGEHYHAYCFARRSFLDAVGVIGGTPSVDPNYWKLGIYRGYWTLRISPRADSTFRALLTLPSQVADECTPDDVINGAVYWTRRL